MVPHTALVLTRSCIQWLFFRGVFFQRTFFPRTFFSGIGSKQMENPRAVNFRKYHTINSLREDAYTIPLIYVSWSARCISTTLWACSWELVTIVPLPRLSVRRWQKQSWKHKAYKVCECAFSKLMLLFPSRTNVRVFAIKPMSMVVVAVSVRVYNYCEVCVDYKCSLTR